MTRAKDHLHLIVPQRFYAHQQRNNGYRHMYALRTRFIPDRHICFRRAPIGTVFRGATTGELLSRLGGGHAHCWKRLVIAKRSSRLRRKTPG
jgi:hypothetical protein